MPGPASILQEPYDRTMHDRGCVPAKELSKALAQERALDYLSVGRLGQERGVQL